MTAKRQAPERPSAFSPAQGSAGPPSAFTELPIAQIKPNPRNARTHTKKQVKQIARSIGEFGFTVPLIIDENNMVLAGHGRLDAARMLGMPSVPCLRIRDWSEAQKAAYGHCHVKPARARNGPDRPVVMQPWLRPATRGRLGLGTAGAWGGR